MNLQSPSSPWFLFGYECLITVRAPLVSLRLCQHLPWTPWNKDSQQNKRLAVYFPAAFRCKILRQLGRGREACEGRACNWSRLQLMKHDCLKRQWHIFSLTCSVRSSLLAWSLTVSHEPICNGLTKVALSAGWRSNRSFVCGEQQRRISTDISGANTHLHAVCWKDVRLFT